MARDVLRIRIESILGGHAPTTHFAASDQFRGSIGIDPSQPVNDSTSNFSAVSSGLIRPTLMVKKSGTTINNAPMWILAQPKSETVFVYDFQGSVYTTTDFSTYTGLSDGGNESGSSIGNGCEYYDNYVYFAKNTTIARYGPLNGTPSLNGDYWGTTLGKTALVNTAYPIEFNTGTVKHPNHILHRHSDGKLYIADVVGNQGTIHYISTTKTTVEGDTDNGSTYSKLQVGYGLWPTAIESYGSDLAIAFYEGSLAEKKQSRAKIAFWDTTSQNVNQITWVEFPDMWITAMKNVNGVLYVFSGGYQVSGFRVTRFVGGYTFEEVAYTELGASPLPGAVDGSSTRLLFGSYSDIPVDTGGSAVYSLGLQKSSLGNGLFCPLRPTGGFSVSALKIVESNYFSFDNPLVGWTTGSSGGANNGIDSTSGSSPTYNSVWWSAMFRVGQPFKITKLRLPIATDVPSNSGVTVTPTIYTDYDDAHALTPLTGTSIAGKHVNVIRPQNLTGDYCFWLQLAWTGTPVTGADRITIGLPITIEYELIDD